MSIENDLPYKVKEKLLRLASHLPESARRGFVKKAGERLGEFTHDHTNTIVYGAVGWVLGEIVDNLLTVGIPFSELAVELSGDLADDSGLVVGAIVGFKKDLANNALRLQITQIVGQELRRALSTV